MLKRFLPVLVLVMLVASIASMAQVDIHQIPELVKKAKGGDTLLIKNGTYSNVALILSGSGLPDKPIVIIAETPGKVLLTGNSYLKIGGNDIEVNGLYFTNGYAPAAVIEFRENNNKLATHCRVSNCLIDNYSKPERFSQDNWIVMWGKNNRFDHNTIGDKLNGGTVLIVNLDDERSRENFHLIDSNYFTGRSRLASNGGEMIRVGVSRYCLAASKTIIQDNLFERCNGEVEIISLKSGENIIRNNLFYECEGGLVLRHGENNTVANNIFLGNNKVYTGGIRVINPGHKIYNNLLIDLAGERFRSAFSVLNGVPNSPLNRYVQVKNAQIYRNSFINCRNIVFGAGKDAERTVAPENVSFTQNFIQYNGNRIYVDENKNGGVVFSDNFYKGKAALSKGFKHPSSVSYTSVTYRGKLYQLPVMMNAGVDLSALHWLNKGIGANWYAATDSVNTKDYQIINVKASEAEALPAMIAKANDNTIFELTDEGRYEIKSAITVKSKITVRSSASKKVELVYTGEKGINAFFIIENGGSLKVSNLNFNSAYKSYGDVQSAIVTTSRPMNKHYNLTVDSCVFYNFNESNYYCIRATKSTYADEVIIRNSVFRNNSGGAIDFSAEKDDKGIYNVERLEIQNCVFANNLSTAINVYRGGNDESTTGPTVVIDQCTFYNVDNREQGCVIKLIGVQTAAVTNSLFFNSGSGGRTVWFEEMGWDKILVDNCNFYQSGRVSSFYGKAKTPNNYMQKPLFVDVAKNNFNIQEIQSSKNISDSKIKNIGAKL